MSALSAPSVQSESARRADWFVNRAYPDIVAGAGLLILAAALTRSGVRLEWSAPRPVFLAVYILADLLTRVSFERRTTISCGFPVLVLTVLTNAPSAESSLTSFQLTDAPLAALVIATLGSVLSEALFLILSQAAGSKLSGLLGSLWMPSRRTWELSLRRTLAYAGHHAIAGGAAWLAYEFVRSQVFSPIRELHIWGALAYAGVYCLASMAVVWPHDRGIRFFVASDAEPLVRVDVTSLFLVPIPTVLIYLNRLSEEQAFGDWLAPVILPGLLIVLYVLARTFAGAAENQTRLALQKRVEEKLGKAANRDEAAPGTLETAQNVVLSNWGAVYGVGRGGFVLLGHGARMRKRDPIQYYRATNVDRATPEIVFADKSPVGWPLQFAHRKGTLGMLAETDTPSWYAREASPSKASPEPSLPAKTALIALPMMRPLSPQDEQDELVGLVVLARPKQRYSRWEREKGMELIGLVESQYLTAQKSESEFGAMDRDSDTIRDPDKLRDAMEKLVESRVDVAAVMGRVSQAMYYENLRDMLSTVTEGPQDTPQTLSQRVLEMAYEQVRSETPGMPDLDARLRALLTTVIESFLLGHNLPYQFPSLQRGEPYKELYRFFTTALEARTLSHLLGMSAQLDRVSKQIRLAHETSETPAGPTLATMAEIEKLQAVIAELEKYNTAADVSAQYERLRQARDLLIERGPTERDRPQDPERFFLVQILFSWRRVLTSELNRVGSGPARLNARLLHHQALPLDVIAVRLVLRNEAPGGIASAIRVEIPPANEYSVLHEPPTYPSLAPGESVTLQFTLSTHNRGALRLPFHIRYNDWERQNKLLEFADALEIRESLPEYDEILNPYAAGMTLRPGHPTFVGREDVFAFVRQNLAGVVGRSALALVGERRTGKTSVLLRLKEQLDGEQYVPVFVNCQPIAPPTGSGLEGFLHNLATRIADRLEIDHRIMVPRLSLEQFSDDPQNVFERRFLPGIRQCIGERVLVLALDEFEHLGQLTGPGSMRDPTYAFLRDLVMHGEQLVFVLAGTYRIQEAIGDRLSAFYNLGMYKRIGLLERKETIRLITEPVRTSGMVYDNLAVDEIVRLTAGQPYLTQLLCTLLVRQCNERQRSYVTIQDVQDARKELIERNYSYLDSLWKTSTRPVQLALAALAELQQRSDYVTTGAIVNRLDLDRCPLPLGQASDALEHLSAREIVCELGGITQAYDFTAQLYGHWLRHHKPLSEVVEVLAQ